MIQVFTWPQDDKHIGHASMLVRGNVYISWWPKPKPGDHVPDPGTWWGKYQLLQTEFQGYANRTLADDRKAEGNRSPLSQTVYGLDEITIIDWWRQFSLNGPGRPPLGPLPAWQAARKNCASIVAMALTVGGGEKYANWSAAHNVVWTPSRVMEYARAIEIGFLKEGARKVLEGQ